MYIYSYTNKPVNLLYCSRENTISATLSGHGITIPPASYSVKDSTFTTRFYCVNTVVYMFRHNSQDASALQ